MDGCVGAAGLVPLPVPHAGDLRIADRADDQAQFGLPDLVEVEAANDRARVSERGAVCPDRRALVAFVAGEVLELLVGPLVERAAMRRV